MELLTPATTGAIGKMAFVVPAHLRRDAGDVVSPACQNCAYDPVGALDSCCRHRASPCKEFRSTAELPWGRTLGSFHNWTPRRVIGCRTSTNTQHHARRLASNSGSTCNFSFGRFPAYHSNSFYLETDSGKRLVLRC